MLGDGFPDVELKETSKRGNHAILEKVSRRRYIECQGVADRDQIPT